MTTEDRMILFIRERKRYLSAREELLRNLFPDDERFRLAREWPDTRVLETAQKAQGRQTHRCEHCNCILIGSEGVWLEVHCETRKWYPVGECPEGKSQGCFKVGKTCSRELLSEED